MKLGMIRHYADNDFDYVKEKGLSFIECCCNNDEESNAFIQSVDSIKRNIDRTGLPIQSVGRWNSAPNVSGKLDADVLDLNLRLMRAAHEIGSPVFVCGCNRAEDISLYRNYQFAVDYFAALLEEADKLSMQVAVYNCSWNNFVYEDKQWEVVLGELPQLMLKFDCSHAYYRGEDYLAELHKWGKRVAHMHVKGASSVNGVRVDDSPAGMDNLDWRRIFSILYAVGYKGGMSIEPHSNVWSGELADAGVDFAIRYIRPFIVK